jgi:hypothetical protein
MASNGHRLIPHSLTSNYFFQAILEQSARSNIAWLGTVGAGPKSRFLELLFACFPDWKGLL